MNIAFGTIFHQCDQRPHRSAGLWWITIVSLTMTLLACQHTPERYYDLKGTVVAIDAKHRQVTIKHENIPGYMNAMTTPFSLKDEWVYQVMTVGDQIQAQLVIHGGRAWLEEVTITQQRPGGQDPAPAETVRAFAPYPAPDFTLTDQDGLPVSLHDLRGKIVLLDFIFTRCPGPCPLLSLTFSCIQQKLGERIGKEVVLVSVTIDPRHDTPAVLKEYAQRYQANLAGWKFLSGSIKDILITTGAFGAAYEANEEGIVNHRLVTYLIDPQGIVVKEFTGNPQGADELIAEVERPRMHVSR